MRLRILVLVVGVVLSACDETISYETPKSQDPLLDDAAPAAASFDETLNFDGAENRSSRRFRFDVAAYTNDAEKNAAEVLYPSHSAMLNAQSPFTARMPSVQTVGTYVKQLDDTIYAGIEHALQKGVPNVVDSKREIVSGSLTELLAHRDVANDSAAVIAAAALRLGGATATVPSDLESRVQATIDGFHADTAQSRPIGFYTWSPELQGIWQQDRLLQQVISPAAACAFAHAIAADSARTLNYTSLTQLYSKLTNPLYSSLMDRLEVQGQACLELPIENDRSPAFLSSSTSAEITLFERLYPGGVPADADLMQDLISAIRNGTVDLTPAPNAGWYAYQTHALETLLVTDKSEERAKVGFTAKYKKRMQEAFATMLVQHRETHAKQLSFARTASIHVVQRPDFTVEPLATVYVRHARSYVFLEKAIDAIYGAALLDQAHPVGANGEATETLRERIRRARDMFFAFYVRSAFELGFRPQLVEGEPAEGEWQGLLAAATTTHLAELQSGEFSTADVRVVVPIAQLSETRIKYWAVIGVRTTLASYSYLVGSSMDAPSDVQAITRVALPTEQFIEYTGSANPPTREELRAICDEKKTAAAIQAALEAR